MSSLLAKLSQCKHPNSRKTKALGKKVKRLNNKHKTRNNHATKSNILGEKLAWFLQKVDGCNEPLTPQEFQNLIELYFKRFDEELEQIHLKQSISKNRTNQHVARENVIKFTLEKEISEYNSGGIELMNLCDKHKMDELKNWDGSAINVQHLKLDLISKNFLNKLQENLEMKE